MEEKKKRSCLDKGALQATSDPGLLFILQRRKARSSHGHKNKHNKVRIWPKCVLLHPTEAP